MKGEKLVLGANGLGLIFMLQRQLKEMNESVLS